MLIKAQTDLTQYGMFPGYNFNEGRLSDKEQRSNINNTVREMQEINMDDIESPNQIYNEQAYDTGMGRQNIEDAYTRSRQQAIRNLLAGNSRQYKDYKNRLEEVLDHDTQSSADAGSMALPESLREYYSRQETLPEHAPSMHTENWQMPDGSIRPGAIPPINAVKQMGQAAIESMMQGAGLLPMYNPELKHWDHNNIPSLFQFDFSSKPYDEDIPLTNPSEATKRYHKFDTPSKVNRNRLAAWATGANTQDMENVIQQNAEGGLMNKLPQGFVGIRGLNNKVDDMQIRPSRGNHQERLNEVAIQSRIPPNRLVPIRHRMDDITGKEARDGYDYPSKIAIANAFALNPNSKRGLSPSEEYIRNLPLTRFPEQFNSAYDKFGRRLSNDGDEGSELTHSIYNMPTSIAGDINSSDVRRNVTPPSWGEQNERMKNISPKVLQEMARQLEMQQLSLSPFGTSSSSNDEPMTFENAERLKPFHE